MNHFDKFCNIQFNKNCRVCMWKLSHVSRMRVLGCVFSSFPPSENCLEPHLTIFGEEVLIITRDKWTPFVDRESVTYLMYGYDKSQDRGSLYPTWCTVMIRARIEKAPPMPWAAAVCRKMRGWCTKVPLCVELLVMVGTKAVVLLRAEWLVVLPMAAVVLLSVEEVVVFVSLICNKQTNGQSSCPICGNTLPINEGR